MSNNNSKGEWINLKMISVILILCIGCRDNQVTVSGLIPAGNWQIYYERQGKGDPILLLHAGLQDHTMWKDQVSALSGEHEVITIDLPFHGATTGMDTVTLIGDIIKTVLDSLHIQKISIAGLSMGGSAVQDFIIAYPQRVNKAILIASGINGFERDHPIDSLSSGWWEQFTTGLEQKDTAAAAVAFTKAWAEGIYRSADSLKAPVSQYVYKTTLQTLRQHKMKGWPLLQQSPPAIDKLSSVKVPVLVIYGDKDLPYIVTSSQYLEKNIPGAKAVVIKDVAHMLNLEKPEEVNELISNFLRKE
ncbi:MAG: alpha/beta hydrolase [Ferruginibacter sp.]|nr:alpha/beta hydrolase [Chitinophagaceae bacterium]